MHIFKYTRNTSYMLYKYMLYVTYYFIRMYEYTIHVPFYLRRLRL